MEDKRILVTFAVPEELVDIKWSGVECFYLRTGIGKMKSTFHLSQAIDGFQPDLVLNIGTAGSIQHKEGDVFYCTQFVDRDLEKVKHLGLSYRVDMTVPLLEKQFAQTWYNEGTCNTGYCFVTDDTQLEGDVIDMEAFAQAWVCEQKGIPFVSIKYITDVVGKNSVKVWKEKLTEAKAGLNKYIHETLGGVK
ncbi:purine or other phosphorylase family 1 [Bacteroides coprosuis DSM 18011]|uniref:Purine or other phosphorylase family 1 n=1 Tax=Bacteroides coprosuis DSM 18011 TaxID=679937 RepID=F3ZTH3_9BACE|nr:MTA/SAH nucleosidase [Bacteroides coprosuis]EGJ71063.1 purine or other phosphorylase family 1 [Bacteroides coprosuis DSM 18011]